MLANTVARVFIQQERSRLESRYVIIHRGLAAQEQHLANLMGLASGNGPADSWLRAQYADAAAKLYEEDTGARIQASNQEASLDIAQPATTAVATGTKASTNAVLGAILAFLVASLIVFVATTAYPRAEAADAVRPVLTKVGE
jgi:hypothetical protein